MPLIADRSRRKKVHVKEEVLANVYEQIVVYCKWAGITDLGYFFEESAKHVFANDKLWQEFIIQKNNK